MQVSNAQLDKVLSLHLQRVYGAANASRAAATKGPDELILSQRASDAQDLKLRLSGLPKIRERVVEEFKLKVNAGDYKVSEMDVAEKMLTSALGSKTRP